MIIPIEYPTLFLFELSFLIKCNTGINPLIYLLFLFIYFKVYLFTSVFTHIHLIYVPKLIIYLFIYIRSTN